MDKANAIKYWIESADHDQETAESLFDLKKYTWSLFIWQLVVEKHLKARLVIKLDGTTPITHDLVKLAKLAELALTKTQINNLHERLQLSILMPATKITNVHFIKNLPRIFFYG